MSTKVSHKLRCTAIHEAGHAIAAVELRRAVLYATIEPSDDTLGHVRNPKPREIVPGHKNLANWHWAFERTILISLAGPAAEAKYRGRRNLPGAARDHMSVAYLVHDEFGPDSDTSRLYVAYMESRAKDLVHVPRIWTGIEMLADELIEHRRVNGKRIKEIYRSAHFSQPGMQDISLDF